ncbi:MAG: sulfotransferase family protein [Mycobacterium sp.]
MGLQVIGAGLGRTGTTSLKEALEYLLGGPCYHMQEVSQRSADPDAWGDAYEGRPPVWGRFFDGYRATVDWPAAPFWSEISQAFPGALILLSVRDPDSWWASVSKTIFPALATYFAPDAPDDGWTRMGRGMMSSFTPDWRDESSAKAAYLAHNEAVRTAAAEGRMLEWHPEEGWDPICAALGCGVPDQPFPHTNTTAQTRAELGLHGP